MKRKREFFQREPMIVSTTLISRLLVISISTLIVATTIANSQRPNSYYISHKIQHPLPTSNDDSLAPLSYNSRQQDSINFGNRQSSNNNNNDNINNNQDLLPVIGNNGEGIVDEGGSSSTSIDLGRINAVNNNHNNHNNEEDVASESLGSEHDESADNSQEILDRNPLLEHHSQLRAMKDLFERRQLNGHHHHHHQQQHQHLQQQQQQQQQLPQQQLPSSQELSPISIGLDPVSNPGSPFNLPPFSVPNHDGHPVPHSKPSMANADNLDQGLGPTLPFGLNPLPHILGFQSPAFDGPQRGDQSAHSNHHTAMPTSDSEGAVNVVGGSQKVWPKIFRFTDGRINLSEFEKQKKIRLRSKNQLNSENHIESAPIMFDGRQLRRKSFLILHGGIFP